MRWQDAIELKHQLAKTCRIPGLLAQTWGTHSLSGEGVAYVKGEPLSQRERDRAMDDYTQRHLPSLFESAEPYYMDRGLVDVVERMTVTIPDEARLWYDLFPTKLGCLFFDRPIAMPPRRLIEVVDLPKFEPAPLSGFAWQVDSEIAVLVYFYAWSVDTDMPNFFRGTYVGNVPLAVNPWDLRRHTVESHTRFHNERIADVGDGDTNNATRFAISVRACVSALHLMAQRLTVCSKMPVDRAAAKRGARAGWLHNNVQVVTLRKIDYSHSPEHETRDIDWSCRWHVREHVRVYNRGEADERRVVIKGYVKGPQEKPLKPLAARVFAVVR